MASFSQTTYLNNQCSDLIWYNLSFHSNACHVCKKKVYGPLDKICHCECRMIYYCCIEHKLEDYIYHASFCTVIQSIFAQVEFSHYRAPTLNSVDWINSRNALINLIEHRLACPLYLHEKQMIIFEKSCLICRTQENLLHCEICCCVNYCLQHKIEATEIHHSYCSDLLECFSLDTYPKHQIFSVKFTKFSNKSEPLENMEKFVEQYLTPITNIVRLLKNYYTDYLSGPLTLCYWIQQFDLFKPESMVGLNFAVHIIDANVLDRSYIGAWHLLLHYLLGVYNLRVELIGSITSYESDPVFVCRLCNSCNKKLSYGCYRESYHQYVSSENYKEPNVIMGFESNLATWNMESVTALKRNIQCPIIITDQSKDELDHYISYINFPGVDVAFSYIFYPAIANPFCSNRPHRRIESDGVSYRNKFVVIFESAAGNIF